MKNCGQVLGFEKVRSFLSNGPESKLVYYFTMVCEEEDIPKEMESLAVQNNLIYFHGLWEIGEVNE